MGDYPLHVPPEGSSKKTLKRASARHTIGDRTQEFTVGSRAAESGGIAAKGSQLEAAGLNMQAAKRKKRKK